MNVVQHPVVARRCHTGHFITPGTIGDICPHCVLRGQPRLFCAEHLKSHLALVREGLRLQ